MDPYDHPTNISLAKGYIDRSGGYYCQLTNLDLDVGAYVSGIDL